MNAIAFHQDRRPRNQSAQDAYAAAYMAACEYLKTLTARLENADGPDDLTDWGDVGDMARLADQLREIVSPE